MDQVFKFLTKYGKRYFRFLIILWLIPILIILASSVYQITLEEGKENKDNPKNTPNVVSKHLQESVLGGNNGIDTDIKGLKTKSSVDGGYVLDVDLDQITDDIITELNDKRRLFRSLF